MSAKEIHYDTEARAQIGYGLDCLADAVKVTMGPRGRNVLLESPSGAPLVTRDGVTVATSIELGNRFENMGAQMVKEVATNTSYEAGDGTTTATVLAQAIFREGAKMVSAGASPVELKRGIDSAVRDVIAHLAKTSRPTRDRGEIARVGTVSANGDAFIGEMIADAMARVGHEGVVTTEESNTMETTLEVVEGMLVDRGYFSPYFVNSPEHMEVKLSDVSVLVYEGRIEGAQALLPLLESVAKSGKPLLLFAEDFDAAALATLVVNSLRGSVSLCAVKAPGYGNDRLDVLRDIAVVAGARSLSAETGFLLTEVEATDLGHARSVTVSRDRTTIVAGAGKKEAIKARAKQIRRDLDDHPTDAESERLNARLGRLVGGVAILRVGATTETEMKEKLARLDDALHATRAAVEEGVVVGGGVALLRAAGAIRSATGNGDERFGIDIVRRALEAPLRQIAENGGVEGSVAVHTVREGKDAFGFNAATGAYEDLLEAGILDPTKVVRVALQNAASIAAMMLTTEATVASASDYALSEYD
jgi:chaperonin GroEL